MNINVCDERGLLSLPYYHNYARLNVALMNEMANVCINPV